MSQVAGDDAYIEVGGTPKGVFALKENVSYGVTVSAAKCPGRDEGNEPATRKCYKKLPCKLAAVLVLTVVFLCLVAGLVAAFIEISKLNSKMLMITSQASSAEKLQSLESTTQHLINTLRQQLRQRDAEANQRFENDAVLLQELQEQDVEIELRLRNTTSFLLEMQQNAELHSQSNIQHLESMITAVQQELRQMELDIESRTLQQISALGVCMKSNTKAFQLKNRSYIRPLHGIPMW
jgi:hypothetical protein